MTSIRLCSIGVLALFGSLVAEPLDACCMGGTPTPSGPRVNVTPNIPRPPDTSGAVNSATRGAIDGATRGGNSAGGGGDGGYRPGGGAGSDDFGNGTKAALPGPGDFSDPCGCDNPEHNRPNNLAQAINGYSNCATTLAFACAGLVGGGAAKATLVQWGQSKSTNYGPGLPFDASAINIANGVATTFTPGDSLANSATTGSLPWPASVFTDGFKLIVPQDKWTGPTTSGGGFARTSQGLQVFGMTSAPCQFCSGGGSAPANPTPTATPPTPPPTPTATPAPPTPEPPTPAPTPAAATPGPGFSLNPFQFFPAGK